MYDVYHYLSKIFLVFPQFCLGDAMVRLSRNQIEAEVYERFDIDRYRDPFSSTMMKWHLVAMAAQGLAFFILTLILDSWPYIKSR